TRACGSRSLRDRRPCAAATRTPGGACSRSQAGARPTDRRRASLPGRHGLRRAGAAQAAHSASRPAVGGARRLRPPRAARAAGSRSSRTGDNRTVQIGDYRLGPRLGEGATGVVHRARHTNGAEVVLKLLRPERDDDAVARARFAREALLARTIDSRHVVPILELGESDGHTYLVLPFYPGGSLALRLHSAGRLSLEETADLAAQPRRGLD